MGYLPEPEGGISVAVYTEKPGLTRAYSFAWVTGAMFLVAWVGQFVFQWIEVANESSQHGEVLMLTTFLPQFLSATLENWQSEFLQLVWQAAESDERLEAKVDELLRQAGVDPASVNQDPVQDVLPRGA